MVLSFQGMVPKIPSSVFIAEGAQIIGDVTIGEHSSIWFNAVVRGDVHSIKIGSHTNIQDNSVLHVFKDLHPLDIGDYVTVGHHCVLHGCTVESHCLIGMGAIILNGAKIGAGSIIAAGSVVTENTVVPPRSLYLGAPAKFRRSLNENDLKTIRHYADNYLEYKEAYLRERAPQKS